MNSSIPLHNIKLIRLGFIVTILAGVASVRTSSGQETNPNPTKTFIDYFQPTPITDSLSQDAWGVPTVGPRDTKNGLEDTSMKQWCYWDGKIIKGPDGKYHMFASRWDQAKGHGNWSNSQAVQAVSDTLLGPYIDQGLLWPDDEGGKGHNVTALTMPDGSYAVIVSETRPGDVFVSKSLDGPWTRLGTIKVADNQYKSLGRASNMAVMVRPDGDFEIVPRSGAILISKTGILGPYTVQGPSVYPKVTGLLQENLEDPVVWFSGGLYHIVVNSWSSRKAFHLVSVDGINNWKYEGVAYDPTKDFVRYSDGTVNHWNKMERPNVYMENGHVVAVTLAALDVPKDRDRGNDNHGSKIVVLPFDGAALDSDLQSVASAPSTAEADAPAVSPSIAPTTTNPSDAQKIVSPQDALQGVKQTVKGGPTTFTMDGDYGGDGTQEPPANALDGDPASKYFCHVQNGTKAPGVDTGLLITPKMGSSIVTGLEFYTGSDMPDRDPMTVTLEGSNDPKAATEGFKDFTLIYEGTSGLDSEPDRGKAGTQVNFSNSTAYKTYRLLITKTRSTTDATQYGEVIFYGKLAP
jgi:hypothetical protein